MYERAPGRIAKEMGPLHYPLEHTKVVQLCQNRPWCDFNETLSLRESNASYQYMAGVNHAEALVIGVLKHYELKDYLCSSLCS